MVSIVPQRPSEPLTLKSKPIKPLLRRAAIRKSDDAGLDGDVLSRPPSPKKAKVTFSSQVEEYSPRPSMRSLESVRGEVRRAIEGHGRGDSEGYDTIKEIFAPRRGGDDATDLDQGGMRQYLLALASCASSLNRGCKGLVGSLLACEWMGRDEAFVKVYVQFLGSLVSTQGIYVSSVLGMLVGHFLGGKMFCIGRSE
jgi:RNA polymerase I-specific transcription initiation factor RRN3